CCSTPRSLYYSLPAAPLALHSFPTRRSSDLRVVPGLGQRPAHPLLARRELGKPQVVEVAARVVGLAHAARRPPHRADAQTLAARSEEHTSELQSPDHLVCRLLLEKKKHQ